MGLKQCCGAGSGSARIRNFLSDPDMDPELEVLDLDPAKDPKLDFNINKLTKKVGHLIP
jgi:hypothetical protein